MDPFIAGFADELIKVGARLWDFDPLKDKRTAKPPANAIAKSIDGTGTPGNAAVAQARPSPLPVTTPNRLVGY